MKSKNELMTLRERYRQLFLQHYEQMLLLARCLLHDEEESRDAVIEVFTLLMENGTIPPHNQEKQYLLTCIRNRCLKIIRHKNVKERANRLLAENEVTDFPLMEENYRDIVQFAEKHLPPLTYQVLTLRYKDGLKYQEVAEVLGISEATVYRHLAQAIHLIKDHFNKL